MSGEIAQCKRKNCTNLLTGANTIILPVFLGLACETVLAYRSVSLTLLHGLFE